MIEPIKITGLTEFQRGLRKLDSDLPKSLRLAFNEAANIVVEAARSKVPHRTGRAAASIKPRSTRTAVRVSAGGNKAPYYPWLDFGGRVGPKKSVRRPFIREGRYIYPSYTEHREEFQRVVEKALADVARSAGLEVD